MTPPGCCVRETVDRTAWHYVRGHFKQRVEHCRTVQCNQCLARTTAEGSPRPFPRAACTTELVVHVGYSKYGLFLPIERQLGEFRRLGLPVSQATFVDSSAVRNHRACGCGPVVHADVVGCADLRVSAHQKAQGSAHEKGSMLTADRRPDAKDESTVFGLREVVRA